MKKLMPLYLFVSLPSDDEDVWSVGTPTLWNPKDIDDMLEYAMACTELSDAFYRDFFKHSLAKVYLKQLPVGDDRKTLLHHAMEAVSLEGVKLCLQQGFDPLAKDRDGLYPIDYCNSEEILKVYLTWCTDVKAYQSLVGSSQPKKPSQFIRCCREGRSALIKCLYEFGNTNRLDAAFFYSDGIHGLHYFALHHTLFKRPEVETVLDDFLEQTNRVESWRSFYRDGLLFLNSEKETKTLFGTLHKSYSKIVLPKTVDPVNSNRVTAFCRFVETLTQESVFGSLEGRLDASQALSSFLKDIKTEHFSQSVSFQYGPENEWTVPAWVPSDTFPSISPELRLQCFLVVQSWLNSLGFGDLKLVIGYSDEVGQLLSSGALFAEGPQLLFILHGMLSHALMNGAFVSEHKSLFPEPNQVKDWLVFMNTTRLSDKKSLLWDALQDRYCYNFRSPFWVTSHFLAGAFQQEAPLLTAMVRVLYVDALRVAYAKDWSSLTDRSKTMAEFVAYGAMHVFNTTIDPKGPNSENPLMYPSLSGIYDITPQGFVRTKRG